MHRVSDEEAMRRVAAQTAQIRAHHDRELIASIVAWLRSPDMDGHCHTHTIAKELERGDFQEWRDSLSERQADD